MAKLIKRTETRPSNEFLVAAPCTIGKFDVVGEPGAWEVEIPDVYEFAITYCLAFGDWELVAPAVWVGNPILNFTGVTEFKFSAGPKPEVIEPAPEPTVDDLRAQLDAKGIEYDNRWGITRLKKALEG